MTWKETAGPEDRSRSGKNTPVLASLNVGRFQELMQARAWLANPGGHAVHQPSMPALQLDSEIFDIGIHLIKECSPRSDTA